MNILELICTSNYSLKRELTIGKIYEVHANYHLESLNGIRYDVCIVTDYGQPMLFSKEQTIQHFQLSSITKKLSLK